MAIEFAIRGAGSSAPWLSIGLAGLGLAAGVSALRTHKALVNMACADAKHVSGRRWRGRMARAGGRRRSGGGGSQVAATARRAVPAGRGEGQVRGSEGWSRGSGGSPGCR